MEIVNSDITIIGGGASGLIAGISALKELKRQNKIKKVTIVDHMDRVGKKILVTGNGKCNLSNKNISLSNYHSNQSKYIGNILNKFDVESTLRFFKSIGLETKQDESGRIYPRSEQASSVLELMRLELSNLGATEITNFKVKNIKKSDSLFLIQSEDKIIKTQKLIIATGGYTTASQGCDGSGHSYLKNFCHKITPVFPSLTQIKVSDKIVKSLKGMRTYCKISIVTDNNILKEEFGELQFTDNGLSGICAFQLSRIVSEFSSLKTVYGIKYKSIEISIDLIPELNKKDTLTLILDRIKSHPNMTLESFFTGILNKRIGQALVKTCNLSLSQKCIELSNKDVRLLVDSLKSWRFTPIGTMPFKTSQVTAGGADLKDFNINTLESKKVKNLYACGEVLDVDGDCGGFNLQWAWSSGYVVGLNSSKNF